MSDSETPLLRSGLQGLRNSPNRLVRRLVATAEQAFRKLDEAQDELRREQEKVAGEQLARTDHLLVVVLPDGGIEVRAADWRPVRVVNVPESKHGEDDALEFAAKRLPRVYRELLLEHHKIVATGFAKCLSKYELEWAKLQLAAIAELRKAEAACAG